MRASTRRGNLTILPTAPPNAFDLEETTRLRELYQHALARQLAAQAELTKNQRPDLLQRSLLLAIESMRRLPSLQADGRLRDGIALLPKRFFEQRREGQFSDVAFHPKGKLAIVASQVQSGRKSRVCIEMLELASGASPWQTRYEGKESSVFISPNSRLLAVASLFFESLVRILDGRTGKRLCTLVHEGEVESVCFSATGGLLAIGVNKRCAYLWDTRNWKRIARLAHTPGGPEPHGIAVAFSPDSRRLITGSYDHTARIWDTSSGRELKRIEGDVAIEEVTWSGDGRFVVLVSGSVASIRDAETTQVIATIQHGSFIKAVTFSHDSQLLLTGSWDETARISDSTTGRELLRVTHGNQINHVSFAPDDRLFTTQGWDNAVRVWSTGKGSEVARIVRRPRAAAIAFSPDSRYLATCAGQNFSLWDSVATPEVPHLKHRPIVNDLAFHCNGTVLATAGGDSTARLWAFSVGREITQLAHGSDVRSVEFSPDGRWLATTTSYPAQVLMVWDTRKRTLPMGKTAGVRSAVAKL